MAGMISLEDHFVSSEQEDKPELGLNMFPDGLLQNLKALGTSRIQDLDKGGVSLQVVSLLPSTEPLNICQQANAQLAEAVKDSNGRLAGFAALPMGQPDEATMELERCVKDLGFLGAHVPNHANGVFYDGPAYRPFWHKAQELDVPIYIHPCAPTEAGKEVFNGLPPVAAMAFSEYSWSWHADVAVHFLRLYGSGLFEPDQAPRVKIGIGHDGEMLPFQMGRTDRMLETVWTKDKLTRKVKDVFRENLWITCSGMWDLAPLACLLRSTSIEKVMFSCDYPFEDSVVGKEFMEEVKKSGLVSEEEYEMIAYKNAEKFLKIKRPAV